MRRRIVRVKKTDPLENYLKTPFEIKKINEGVYLSHQEDYYSPEELNSDPFYLVTQFFIHKKTSRNNEMKYCLKKNTNVFDKIFLLNEREYSNEEMGVDSEKITQVVTGERMSYKHAIEQIKNSGLKGYFVVSNSDIFFDETLENLRRSSISKRKTVKCLLRYEFMREDKIFLKKMTCSQDSWIFHSNFLPEGDLKKTDILLGKPGCDNAIAYIFSKMGFVIQNDPSMIKSYHYHIGSQRDYDNFRDKIPTPYLDIVPT